MMGPVLIVEDDAPLRDMLREELVDAGYTVVAADAIATARAQLTADDPALIISDLRLPDGDGMALLQMAQSMGSSPAFIMITAYGTVGTAVQALKAGAHDFLTKPLDVDHLLVSVERVLEQQRVQAQLRRYQKLLGDDGFHGLLGRSKPMQILVDNIRMVAESQAPVLIVGESGTGKELVARALHAESVRRSGPFMAVNGAGVPAELLESEFFGHVAGAFTGANVTHRGLFDQADGGTLFLDEIGDMPAPLQAKLLRVLQDGRIRPVGAKREHQVDVRVVAATHQDLDALRAQGDFREDLYFRLETFVLSLPPLRERGDDIELLAGRFLQRYAAASGRDAPEVAPAVLRCLTQYRFPGNVRELQNIIERAITFCRSGHLVVEHLPERLHNAALVANDVAGGKAQQPVATLAEVSYRHVRDVLERTDGNKRQAAALLGISRKTLYRYLEQR